MLLQNLPQLEDVIVQLLAKRRSATAAWLKKQIAEKEKNYSIQGIYKELNKLIRQGVIVKYENQFRLSLPWIVNVVDLADSMYDVHVEQAKQEARLPLAGEKQQWIFSDLRHVDEFWLHISLLLFQHSETKSMYRWIPHPWFHLIHGWKHGKFTRAIRIGGYTCHSIIGNTTLLDLRSQKLQIPGVFEYSFRADMPQEEQLHYYACIDSYVATMTLDLVTARAIESLYQSVKSLEDLDPGDISELISTRGIFRLELENNEEKASNILSMFTEKKCSNYS